MTKVSETETEQISCLSADCSGTFVMLQVYTNWQTILTTISKQLVCILTVLTVSVVISATDDGN